MRTESVAPLTREKRGHVFLVGQNEPKKLNSFGLEMLRLLGEAFTAYEDDDELRCLLLFAHGEHFTSGLRLDEVGPAVRTGQPLFPEGSVDPLDLFGRKRQKPVVCAVQGWCLTIGVELLLACDIGIAASDTRFAQMEVQRGIMPFGGATLRFHQRCGWGNAMRWLLTGGRFDATEALRIGLVQEVVSPEALFERGVALAEEIAAQAPLAVQASRRNSVAAATHGPEAALQRLLEEARALLESEDAAEGVRSFVERRPARFRGR